MPDYITVCEKAARAGGHVLQQWLGRIKATEKAPKDLVTEADLESQQVIREILLGAFPDHQFLGEEQTPRPEQPAGAVDPPEVRSGFRWLVDPLDGTTNYVHQLPVFSVSVALEHMGQLLVAAVFNPVAQECYTAQAGQGAQLNGRPLATSSCRQLAEALVAASFSANVPRGSPEVARFVEVLHSCQALRRLGSAALNLCYVAAGRLDAYWATSVEAWDVAAGILLVREAGGMVTSIDGGPFDLARPKFVAAATRPLHEQLITSLSRAC